MSFSNFLRRATSSLKFWSPASQTPDLVQPAFQLDEVAERLAKIQVPQAKEPTHFHFLLKLAPIPIPRKVRWEGQVVYSFAWLGTAVLAWGGFQVPADWLLWYGAASVAIFAVLFRIEGPLTRVERLQRAACVQRTHATYLDTEAHLKAILSKGFNERMEEVNSIRAAYDDARQALELAATGKQNNLLSILSNPLRTEKTPEEALMEQMSAMERQMLALIDELEDYSDIHKEAIDKAIMARHNARLAYWQARLDEAALTGEAVQQH